MALLDQFEDLASQQPILLMFEDAHWADATSLELLDLTVERVRQLPVLALFTFRPILSLRYGKFEPSRDEFEQAGAPSVSRT